jgi:hypothetical protein
MTYYDLPTRLAADTEDRIFAALDRLLPKAISPDEHGILTLPANRCDLYGPTLEYMPEDHALGWNNARDACSWKIDVPRAGRYVVSLEWSCDASCAGNQMAIECGDARIVTTVPSTGTWQQHQTREFGELELAPGPQRVTVRADGPIKEALLDLRWMKLTPKGAVPR